MNEGEGLDNIQFWLRAGIAAAQRWPGVVDAQVMMIPEARARWRVPVFAGLYPTGDADDIELEKFADRAGHSIRMGYGVRSRTLLIGID